MTIALAIAGTTAVALVDDDQAHLARYRWRISPQGDVFRYGDKTIYLKNVVFGAPPSGFGICYADGNKLDNRRSNLRCIPLRYTAQACGAQKRNKLGLRGVFFDKSRGKYVAQVTIEGRQFNLGRFASPEDAAAVAREFRLKNMPYTIDRRDVQTSVLQRHVKTRRKGGMS